MYMYINKYREGFINIYCFAFIKRIYDYEYAYMYIYKSKYIDIYLNLNMYVYMYMSMHENMLM